ncbi:MAG TPA: glutamate--tRNA ligase, partial [Stellaceae bacterium]|nr:glutamate--tRNA ligase [Stellaceae bacterium]
LLTGEARQLLGELKTDLADADWKAAPLEQKLRDFTAAKAIKLGAAAQPLRAALTGSVASPGIFEIMEVLGRDETLARIADAAAGRA